MKFCRLYSVLFIVCSSIIINADPVKIIGYDIFFTRPDGFGNWHHFYDGTITDLGNGKVSYTDGSGTLNDGIIGTGTNNTQLFSKLDATQIILYFDDEYDLDDISLFSFGPTTNGIPGNITSFNISLNGQSSQFATTGFGPSNTPPNNVNGLAHEYVDLSNSFLNNASTNQITLSNFNTMGNYPSYFSISEIQLNGSHAVPEPGILTLLVSGLLFITGISLKRKK